MTHDITQLPTVTHEPWQHLPAIYMQGKPTVGRRRAKMAKRSDKTKPKSAESALPATRLGSGADSILIPVEKVWTKLHHCREITWGFQSGIYHLRYHQFCYISPFMYCLEDRWKERVYLGHATHSQDMKAWLNQLVWYLTVNFKEFQV